MPRIQPILTSVALAVLISYFTGPPLMASLPQATSAVILLKKEAKQLAKWVDTSVDSLMPMLPGVMAHDKDVISFFDSICPEGWVPYERARNKFIMGSNTDDEIGLEGGSNKVTLTAANLPSHTHYAFTVQGVNAALTTNNYPSRTSNRGVLNDYEIFGTNAASTHGQTSATGQGQEFEITPPYIKLKLCRKENENVLMSELDEVKTNLNDHIADFEAFKPQVEQLQNDLNQLKVKYQQIDQDFQDYRGYALTFHVIAVVALIFLIFDMIMWLISIARIRRLQRDAQNIRYADTPRTGGDRYR